MKPILILAISIFFCSCRTDNKPRIVHSATQNQDNLLTAKDSAFIEIVDLPIEIDSTDYLIHPVGYSRVEDSRDKIIYKSSNYRSQNFSFSSYGGYTLSGNLTNVLFQHKNAKEIIPLTNDFIKIESMTFLKKVSDNIQKQYLVYKIKDKDTNLDGNLDYQDVSSLYISKIDGTRFTKLSKENYELLDWKLIESKNLLYFRTVEDSNEDGAFDNTDIIHYKYINLNVDDLKAIDYKPL